MMSIDYINQLADEAGKNARRNRSVPVAFASPVTVGDIRRIPNIGSFRPKGWNIQENRMADKTGMGAADEPALTVPQLIRWINDHSGDGFAIIEEGQFQVVLGRFSHAG